MKFSDISKKAVFGIVLFLLVSPILHSQSKKLKRPSFRIGILNVDNFVVKSFYINAIKESFELYYESSNQLSYKSLKSFQNVIETNNLITHKWQIGIHSLGFN